MLWNKICLIFDTIKKFVMNIFRKLTTKSKKTVYRNPEIGSSIVRIAHKISSTSSETQLVKIGDKYYRVRELG